jgi:hypothetical protein
MIYHKKRWSFKLSHGLVVQVSECSGWQRYSTEDGIRIPVTLTEEPRFTSYFVTVSHVTMTEI